MSLTTYTLTIPCRDGAGAAVAGAKGVAELFDSAGRRPLTDYLVGGVIVATRIEFTADANGDASVDLVSNLDGNQDSRWRITATHPTTGAQLIRSKTADGALVQMPRAASTLTQLVAASPVTASSEAGAAESAALAEKWATEVEDTPVETGPDKFSALHHAAKAAASASASSTSAGQSSTSATAAGDAQTAAETARDKSQDWAESATAPGATGTKSSKTHAAESVSSADLSEAWATGTEPGGAGTKSAREEAVAAAASAASIDPQLVPLSNSVLKSQVNAPHILPGWLESFAALLPAYEALPQGWYETGETVGTLKVIVNYDPATALFDYGTTEAFLSSDEAYTLSTGTILADPGDPVGLLLDGRYRLERGAELVVGGDFSDPADWSAGTGWAVSSGSATCDGTNAAQVTQGSEAVAGQWYEIEYTVSVQNSGSLRIVLGTFTDVVPALVGTYMVRLKAPSNGAIGLRSTSFDGSVSNISVRPLPGNHALQSNSALRGSFGRAPKDVRNLLRHTEDFTQSYWGKSAQGDGIPPIVTGNQGVAPDGTITADRVQFERLTATSPNRSRLQVTNVAVQNGKTYVLSGHAKAFGGVNQQLSLLPNFGNGTITPVAVTAQWQRFSATATATADTSTATLWYGLLDAANSDLTSDILLWGVQFEEEEETNYQRVGASTLDVTEEGVTSHGFIRHNGVDQNIPATVPAITDGVLIVSGRDWTWVQEGYNAPGSHALNTGAVSGYSGWADVTGLDQVAVTLKDGPMTESEITREMARMQALGGGPKVVAFAPTGNLKNWFRGLGLHLLDVGDWDVSGVTSFDYSASDNDLTTLDVSDWNTAAVTSFYRFARNNALTTLDVSGWNTGAVTNFANFAQSNALTTLDVSDWNTGAVTNFGSFAQNNNLTTLDVSLWNTAAVTNFYAFAWGNNLTTLDVSLWNTAAVTSFYRFARDNALTTLDVSLWNTAAVTSFGSFAQNNNLTTLDVSLWNTAAVTNFASFARNNALTTLDVSDWNTGAVTNFGGFAQDNNLTTLDVSLWNTGAVTSFFAFAYRNNLTTLDVSLWNTAAVTNFGRFAYGNNLTTLDVSGWNTGAVTTFSQFAQSNALTTLDVSDWSTNCTNWTNFCRDNALTAAALDGILVMIAAQGTSNGTFSTSGGSMNAPTATGEAAIDTLRGRGWTVTVPGGY